MHHLPRPNAKLSCFHKKSIPCWHKNFNNLPPSVTILKSDEAKFKTALSKHQHTHCFYCVDGLFVCKDDLYCFCKMCVVFYICIFVYLWLAPHPAVFVTHLWIHRKYAYVCVCVCVCMCVCLYVCMYVHTYLCMYVCMNICMCVYMCICMYECMCVCMYVHTYLCMYVFFNKHFFIYRPVICFSYCGY